MERDQKDRFHLNLEQLTAEIVKFLKNNDCELQRTPVQFKDNKNLLKNIPPVVVNICLFSLNESPSSYTRGLELATAMINSKKHGLDFI